MSDAMECLLLDMISDHQELTSSSINRTSFDPLIFAGYVKRNEPVILTRLGRGESLRDKWTIEYLIGKLGDQQLSVAATPNGNADAIVDGVFVEPAYVPMTMRIFASKMMSPEPGGPVYYFQSQNDNLNAEMAALQKDVESLIHNKHTQSLNAIFDCDQPDAVNVWMGDDRSVTSTHKDPYENLYYVIRGSKTFTLLPPTEFFCLHGALRGPREDPAGGVVSEQIYPTGQYSLDLNQQWSIKRNEDSQIPWIPVNPIDPDLMAHPRFKQARPLSVTVKEGEVLYLPALWYHRVAQEASTDPACPLAIAVNVSLATSEHSFVTNLRDIKCWYDLAYDSPVWTLSQLIRKMSLAVNGRKEDV